MLGPLIAVLAAAIAFAILSAVGVPVLIAAVLAVVVFFAALPATKGRFGAPPSRV